MTHLPQQTPPALPGAGMRVGVAPPCNALPMSTATAHDRTCLGAIVTFSSQLVEARAQRPGERPQRPQRRLRYGSALDAADDGGRDAGGPGERLLGEARGFAQRSQANADGTSGGRCAPWHQSARIAVMGARCP